jgi:hypothetical protein
MTAWEGTTLRKTSSKITFRANACLAKDLWGPLSKGALKLLRVLTLQYGFCIHAGDLQLIEGKWYVTHAGLLRLASRKHCSGINTSLQAKVSDPTANRWVFRAIAYKNRNCRGFVGYADADPSNVSLAVHGAELRIAETRAVDRSLRKAYGVGLCSVEELGVHFQPAAEQRSSRVLHSLATPHVNDAGQPRLRDQLCMLIRQFQLDPALVKRYAASYCGADSISAASRESVES